jgi:hypothetical protein
MSATLVAATECLACHQFAIWVLDAGGVVRLVDPHMLTAPTPHHDMPEDARADYEEARRVLDASPRAAAGLLRLATEKLVEDLGAVGKDLNARIGDLVAKGLAPQIQQALDSLRVIGNEAVHPGTMDLRDDRATALALFQLINLVVDQLIARDRAIGDIYAMLPEAKRLGIGERDHSTETPPVDS